MGWAKRRSGFKRSASSRLPKSTYACARKMWAVAAASEAGSISIAFFNISTAFAPLASLAYVLMGVGSLTHPILEKRQAQVGIEAVLLRRLTANGLSGYAEGFNISVVSSSARLRESRII